MSSLYYIRKKIDFVQKKLKKNKKKCKFLKIYTILLIKNKLNKSLKDTFLNEKEITNLNDLKYLNKVNLCENCNVLNYKKYMYPFNRVTKTNNCLICKKESKNLVFIKKRV